LNLLNKKAVTLSYPVSTGCLAFSQPAMPSGITNTSV
jgi:hypothetical protein